MTSHKVYLKREKCLWGRQDTLLWHRISKIFLLHNQKWRSFIIITMYHAGRHGPSCLASSHSRSWLTIPTISRVLNQVYILVPAVPFGQTIYVFIFVFLLHVCIYLFPHTMPQNILERYWFLERICNPVSSPRIICIQFPLLWKNFTLRVKNQETKWPKPTLTCKRWCSSFKEIWSCSSCSLRCASFWRLSTVFWSLWFSTLRSELSCSTASSLSAACCSVATWMFNTAKTNLYGLQLKKSTYKG